MMAYLVRLAAALLLAACAWPLELDAWTHGTGMAGGNLLLNGSGVVLTTDSSVRLTAR